MSGILIIAEQRRGELRPVTLELDHGGAGRCARAGDEVTVALIAARARALRTGRQCRGRR